MKTILKVALIVSVGILGEVPRTVASGGAACADATVIASVPFTDSDDTCLYGNTYGEMCPGASAAEDTVYRYTPVANECVNVELCDGTVFDSTLYVYASDSGGCPAPGSGETALDMACDDNGCPPRGAVTSRLPGLLLDAGVTYHFVVDGHVGECGSYTLDISPCSAPTCVVDIDCCDGVFCNGQELCIAGQCQSGTTPSCDDGNSCTTDTCDEVNLACVHLPTPECCRTDAECDDGNRCTDAICAGADACNLGTCQYPPLLSGTLCGPPQSTECDGADTCDGSGVCETNVAADGTPCDDGLFCSLDSSCSTGLCVSGTLRSCDDGNPCTVNSCDGELDICVFSGVPNCCGSDADCSDGNDCTTDTCSIGVCSNVPVSVGTSCGSDLLTDCTAADTCDAGGVCQRNDAAAGTICDDLDACTDNDICSSGACMGLDNGLCGTCGASGLFDWFSSELVAELMA